MYIVQATIFFLSFWPCFVGQDLQPAFTLLGIPWFTLLACTWHSVGEPSRKGVWGGGGGGLLSDPPPGGGGGLASPGRPTHPPTSEKVPSGKKMKFIKGADLGT